MSVIARLLHPRSITCACAIAITVFAIACSSDDELGPMSGIPVGTTSGDGGQGPAPSSATAKGGEDAVRTRKCGDCHGANLAGASAKLPGYPDGVELYAPNLTPDQATGIGTWTDGQLELAIREGLDKEGMVLCPQMQHYRSMPQAELTSIIQYLRSIPPVVNGVRESICPPLKR